MKKRFLTFLLAICLIMPCFLILTACGPSKRPFTIQILAPDELSLINPVAFLGEVDGEKSIDASTTGGTGELNSGESKTFAVYVFDTWELSTLKILQNGENIFNLDPDFQFADVITEKNIGYKAGTLTINNIQDNIYLSVEAELRKIAVNVKFTDENQTAMNMPTWANDMYFLDCDENKVWLSDIWGYNSNEYYTFYIDLTYIHDAVPLFCNKSDSYWQIVDFPTGEYDENDNEIYKTKFNGNEDCNNFFHKGTDEYENLDEYTSLYKTGFKELDDGVRIFKDNVTFNLTARYNSQDTIVVRAI